MAQSRRLGDGRYALVGTLAHRLLFGLLTPEAGPAELSGVPFEEALSGVDRLLATTGTSSVERRALRQRAAGAAVTYLRQLLPPEPWRVLVVDAVTAGGRVDVIWHAGPDVLLDEIKTGSYAATLTSTHEQVTRYLRALQCSPPAGRPRTQDWPAQPHIVGARLLVTARPEDSWYLPLAGPRTNLTSAPLIRDRCRPPPRLT